MKRLFLIVVVLLTLLMLAILWAQRSEAAVAYVGKVDCTSTANVNQVTCPVASPPCADCIMIMTTQIRSSGSPVPVSSAAFNSTESLTKIGHGQYAGGPFYRTELWYRVEPTETTANLVVNFAATIDEAIGVTVIFLSGAHQTTPIDVWNAASGAAGTLAVPITTTQANTWGVSSAIGREDGGLTVGAGATARTDRMLQSGGVNDGAGVSTVDGIASPGPVSLTWTQSQVGTGTEWSMVAAAIIPATGSTPPPPVQGAIAFDTQSTNGGCLGVTQCQLTHTGTGANLAAVIPLRIYDPTPADRAISSVTYGGVPATCGVVEDPGGDTVIVALCWVTGIAQGPQTVTVNMGGGTVAGIFLQVVTFTGVDQTNPVNITGHASAGSGTPSTSVTNTAVPSMLVDVVVATTAIAYSPGSGQTAISPSAQTPDDYGTSYKLVSTSASHSMTWSGSSTGWRQVMIALTASQDITIVQVSQLCSSTNAPAQCVLPATPQVGRMLFIALAWKETNGTGGSCAESRVITDPQGVSYSLAGETLLYDQTRISVWWRHVTSQPSGTFPVSMHCPVFGGNSTYTMQVLEVAGLAQNLSVFDTAGVFGTVTPPTSQVTSGTVMRQPNQFALAVMSRQYPDATVTVGSGWTSRGLKSDCSAFPCLSVATRIIGAIETVSHTWTLTSSPAVSAPTAQGVFTFNGAIGAIITTRTITWKDNANNETYYRVEKKTDQSHPNWLSFPTLAPNTQLYTHTLPAGETGDCYRVFVGNAAGEVKSVNPDEFCTFGSPGEPPPPPPPPPPVGVTIGGLSTLGDDELL